MPAHGGPTLTRRSLEPAPSVSTQAPEHLTVSEAAALLRISTRQVYDGVARKGLPHLRAGGRLLFERAALDHWLRGGIQISPAQGKALPAVIGGSHDPLLEWAVRESGCGLALLTGGSTDGIERMTRGEVCAALVHLPAQDPHHATRLDFNRAAVAQALSDRPVALIQWAHREQGWMVAPGNPKSIRGPADLLRRGVAVALRQPGAGSAVLLETLLARDRIALVRLKVGAHCHSESDLAQAVRTGQADVGLGARAAALAAGLDFIPVIRERLDLVVDRAAWFEPGLQRLWSLVRSRRLDDQARRLGGYDLQGQGTVIWNAQH